MDLNVLDVMEPRKLLVTDSYLMQPTPFKSRRKPESILQEAIIKELRYYEWIVIPTHGSKYQSGMPDLVCMHLRYGWRFVEVKRPKGSSFTAAQDHWFPLLKKIWIMKSPDDYPCLMGAPNWHIFYKTLYNHRLKKYTPAKTTGSKDKNAEDIMLALKVRGYKLMHTHGNIYQRGLPDILAVHPKHGIKWVEVKNKQYRFTGAQMKYLKQMMVCDFPVWIIQEIDELKKLNGPCNVRDYL